jgi:hypothetical protein
MDGQLVVGRHATWGLAKVGGRVMLADVHQQLVDVVKKFTFFGYIERAYLFQLDSESPAEDLLGLFGGD